MQPRRAAASGVGAAGAGASGVAGAGAAGAGAASSIGSFDGEPPASGGEWRRSCGWSLRCCFASGLSRWGRGAGAGSGRCSWLLRRNASWAKLEVAKLCEHGLIGAACFFRLALRLENPCLAEPRHRRAEACGYPLVTFRKSSIASSSLPCASAFVARLV